jgi:hypothetical protein
MFVDLPMETMLSTITCYVILSSPQFASPLPIYFVMRFCIQNASQRHCRVTWSQTPWPAWHNKQYHIHNANTIFKTWGSALCASKTIETFPSHMYVHYAGENSISNGSLGLLSNTCEDKSNSNLNLPVYLIIITWKCTRASHIHALSIRCRCAFSFTYHLIYPKWKSLWELWIGGWMNQIADMEMIKTEIPTSL